MKYTWADTDKYIKIYEQSPSYGSEIGNKLQCVTNIVDKQDIKSLLDFGCGPNAVLLKKLSVQYPSMSLYGYDPAMVVNTELVKSDIPEGLVVDMVVSTDCLEHIPTDELPQCWKIFSQLSPKVMYHIISTRPALKILCDGSNAHKTVNSSEWWSNEMKHNLKGYTVVDHTTDNQKQNHYAFISLIKNF